MARIFRVSKATINRWAARYQWPQIKLGRRSYYDPAEIETHMRTLGYRITNNNGRAA